jgi:hypothetical protein
VGSDAFVSSVERVLASRPLVMSVAPARVPVIPLGRRDRRVTEQVADLRERHTALDET